MKKDSFCETKNRDFLVESSEAYTIYITADTLLTSTCYKYLELRTYEKNIYWTKSEKIYKIKYFGNQFDSQLQSFVLYIRKEEKHLAEIIHTMHTI